MKFMSPLKSEGWTIVVVYVRNVNIDEICIDGNTEWMQYTGIWYERSGKTLWKVYRLTVLSDSYLEVQGEVEEV